LPSFFELPPALAGGEKDILDWALAKIIWLKPFAVCLYYV
jgi:hypothetical protein